MPRRYREAPVLDSLTADPPVARTGTVIPRLPDLIVAIAAFVGIAAGALLLANGWHSAGWRRTAAQLLPVVVLTTSDAREDIEKVYALGANSYVVKPSSFAGLVGLISDLGKYWLEVVELPPAPLQ